MADEMGISVIAGGEITREAFDVLLAAIDKAGHSFDGLNPLGGAITMSSTANYGDTSDIRAALERAGLSYRASTDAKYEHSGEIYAWYAPPPSARGPAQAPRHPSGAGRGQRALPPRHDLRDDRPAPGASSGAVPGLESCDHSAHLWHKCQTSAEFA